MMRVAPVVSIVMAVHNGGPLLKRSVESALSQTLENHELILVNDGSTDGCIETVRRLDPRISCIYQSNQGASAATQTGLLKARAPLVAFLDQDDLWSSGKLAAQVAIFDGNPSTLLAFSATSYIGPSGEDLPLPRRIWDGPITFEELMSDFVIGNTSSVLLRRDAALAEGGFDPSFRFMYDLDLFLRIALTPGARIVGDSSHWTYYRRHERQMSRRWEEMAAEWERLLAKIAGCNQTRFKRCEQRARLNMNRYIAYLAYETGSPLKGLGYLASSLRRSPLDWARDGRNVLVAAACIAKLALPDKIVRALAAKFHSQAAVSGSPGGNGPNL
jgi:glycosyltransferase involved in cell wall biosynthesis